MLKRKQSLILVLITIWTFLFTPPVLAQEVLEVSHHYVGVEEVGEGYQITFDMTVANTSLLDLYDIELLGQDPMFFGSDGISGSPLQLESLTAGEEMQVAWVIVAPNPILARKEKFIDQRLLPIEGFATDVGGRIVLIQTQSLGVALRP